MMIKLTVIVDGHKYVRHLTPQQVHAVAEELTRIRSVMDRHAVTLLFEGADKVVHIVARRDRIAA